MTTVADHKPSVTREQWRKTVLAAMANYIDSGSIVAGAVSLPIWTTQFGFGSGFVSLLGAFSSNAISAGIGALSAGASAIDSAARRSTSGTCCSTRSAHSGSSSPNRHGCSCSAISSSG